MSNRAAISSALQTMLSASGTGFLVVQVNSNADIKIPYDLRHQEIPAIKIHLTDESVDYHPNLRGLNKLGADFYIYCIEWDKNSTAQEEVLLKSFRDVVGSDITLLGTAIDLSIASIIKAEVPYPLVMYKVNANIIYETSISSV
jgi:hypothetical protein